MNPASDAIRRAIAEVITPIISVGCYPAPVDRIINEIPALDDHEYVALALACLDQAGLSYADLLGVGRLLESAAWRRGNPTCSECGREIDRREVAAYAIEAGDPRAVPGTCEECAID